MLSPINVKHEILGDTDQETIINNFVCKKCDVMKLFVADFFQKEHIHRATETRVTSLRSFLSILRNLMPLQLLYSAPMYQLVANGF